MSRRTGSLVAAIPGSRIRPFSPDFSRKFKRYEISLINANLE